MIGIKTEFPPLLSVGMHDMTLPDLRHLCVTKFPLSTTRERLMRGIEALCGSLTATLLRTEVWVNGSFMTQKIDPVDADLVVRIHASLVNNAGTDQQALLGRIANKKFQGCDSYVLTEYSEHDANYQVGDMMLSYWKSQFGISRSQNFKGIAVVRTPLS